MSLDPSPLRDDLGLVWDDGALRVETQERHGNIGGTVHGGLLMTLLDSVMGGTIIAGLPDDQVAVTASMTVGFVAPAQIGDVLVARADVVRQGRRLAHANAWVTREGSDERLATASGVFAIVARSND